MKLGKQVLMDIDRAFRALSILNDLYEEVRTLKHDEPDVSDNQYNDGIDDVLKVIENHLEEVGE